MPLLSQLDVAIAIENFNSESRSEFRYETDTLRVIADKVFCGKNRKKARAECARRFFSACSPSAAATGEGEVVCVRLQFSCAAPTHCRNLPSGVRWSTFGVSP
jgi:hypothetical protein